MSVARDTPSAAPRTNCPRSTLRSNGAGTAALSLVTCRGASAGFDGRAVIEGIDLEVRVGETVAIVGRSGCGKTTLLHLLAGLVAPSSGAIDAAPAALMPQRDGLLPWASASDNAALPLRIAGVSKREARDQADRALTALGLAAATTRRVSALSGGMRQRVALARTLLTGRSLLLLDEPLASVDALTRSELHAVLLDHLAQDGHGAVLVTHDLDEALLLADRVLVLAPPRAGHSVAMRVGGPLATGTPSTLRPAPALSGAPGDPLAARGGDEIRAALLSELAP